MDEINKKQVGLTNSQIAELIFNLNDRDFYEVFELLHDKTEKDLTIGQFIDMCMNEIKSIMEE